MDGRTTPRKPRRWPFRIAALLVAAAMLAPVTARASSAGAPALAARHFADPAGVGSATFNYLFWTIYDARLVAPGGVYRADAPLMLTLTYRRDIRASDILDTTVDELRRQGIDDAAVLARWRAALEAIIPDIRAGDSIAGVRDAAGETIFYVNGAYSGRIADPAFGRHFFDIWLGPQSRDRRFTAQLTGARD